MISRHLLTITVLITVIANTDAHWKDNHILGPTCSGNIVEYSNLPDYDEVTASCDHEKLHCRPLCILSKLGMMNTDGYFIAGKSKPVLQSLLPPLKNKFKATELTGAYEACSLNFNFNDALGVAEGCASYGPLLDCFRKSTIMICEGVKGFEMSPEHGSAADPWPSVFVKPGDTRTVHNLNPPVHFVPSYPQTLPSPSNGSQSQYPTSYLQQGQNANRPFYNYNQQPQQIPPRPTGPTGYAMQPYQYQQQAPYFAQRPQGQMQSYPPTIYPSPSGYFTGNRYPGQYNYPRNSVPMSQALPYQGSPRQGYFSNPRQTFPVQRQPQPYNSYYRPAPVPSYQQRYSAPQYQNRMQPNYQFQPQRQMPTTYAMPLPQRGPSYPSYRATPQLPAYPSQFNYVTHFAPSHPNSQVQVNPVQAPLAPQNPALQQQAVQTTQYIPSLPPRTPHPPPPSNSNNANYGPHVDQMPMPNLPPHIYPQQQAEPQSQGNDPGPLPPTEDAGANNDGNKGKEDTPTGNQGTEDNPNTSQLN